MANNTFKILNAINVTEETKAKNGLNYLPWAKAWAEVKENYPDAFFTIYSQKLDELGNTRFWHDDGKTGWTDVSVTIEGKEERLPLPVMDHKNQAIPAENITSMNANKTLLRNLVKCCALHGLGLHVYMGEDTTGEEQDIAVLVESIRELVKKKVTLSDKAKAKVKELCVAAEKKANPELDDDLITGNYANIDNVEILEELEKQLMAVRK